MDEYIPDLNFADANGRSYSSVEQFVESATNQFEECQRTADGGNGGGGSGGNNDSRPGGDEDPVGPVGDGSNGGGGGGGRNRVATQRPVVSTDPSDAKPSAAAE